MYSIFILFIFVSTLSASFKGIIVDANTYMPIQHATISGDRVSTRSDTQGNFIITTDTNKTLHVKALGYKPFHFTQEHPSLLKLQPIKVKALYLNFWSASNNSKTLKRVLHIIDNTPINALVIDVKNEYGSTQFLTGFERANRYGAYKKRTNRNIKKFMEIMKQHSIYTIARIVTFKDELQASNNYEYAIKKEDKTIWRNHDKMAWVDPFDTRAQDYAISIAEEAAKVGYDEINFDYIRFPARKGLVFSKKNTEKNRVYAIEQFLKKAKKRLEEYGVFISVNTYGNVCWKSNDTGIGQTIASLAKYADYIAPMLYPSGFSSGSFYVKYPSKHPYKVIFRSVKHMQSQVLLSRVRPWLQYFKDYSQLKKIYTRKEIQAQIKASDDIGTNGWMFWSPSSRYSIEYLK